MSSLKTESKNEKKAEEKVDLGLLEEDDEFEEFPAEDWQGKADDDDLTIWEDNWDDDDIEDDFSKQLKAELEKQKMDSTEQMQ
ncbi:putative 26S proteasome complex subunit sem1 [Halotydeus destructor]|nr:putative 26S proteasome complex subunit sem1 [Halotydeus destructor]